MCVGKLKVKGSNLGRKHVRLNILDKMLSLFTNGLMPPSNSLVKKGVGWWFVMADSQRMQFHVQEYGDSGETILGQQKDMR